MVIVIIPVSYTHIFCIFALYNYQVSLVMKNLERLFAEKLLKIKAIKLQPANPFTWASGWKSTFYCDNRKTLSYPSLRNFVKIETTRLILERFGQVDAIAAVSYTHLDVYKRQSIERIKSSRLNNCPGRVRSSRRTTFSYRRSLPLVLILLMVSCLPS